MFEIILIVASVIGIGRMAEEDRGEGFKWGAVTFALCLASFIIPLPFLRILVAIAVSFGLMTFTKKTFY